jgi:hypothetical protein
LGTFQVSAASAASGPLTLTGTEEARECAGDLLLMCSTGGASALTSSPPNAESVEALVSRCQGYLDKFHHILTASAISEAESDDELSRLCDLLDSAISIGTEKASALGPWGSRRGWQGEGLAEGIQG